MRVKIIKATSKHSWYANKIGEEFNVIDFERKDTHYELVEANGLLIKKQDCEIIEV